MKVIAAVLNRIRVPGPFADSCPPRLDELELRAPAAAHGGTMDATGGEAQMVIETAGVGAIRRPHTG